MKARKKEKGTGLIDPGEMQRYLNGHGCRLLSMVLVRASGKTSLDEVLLLYAKPSSGGEEEYVCCFARREDRKGRGREPFEFFSSLQSEVFYHAAKSYRSRLERELANVYDDLEAVTCSSFVAVKKSRGSAGGAP